MEIWEIISTILGSNVAVAVTTWFTVPTERDTVIVTETATIETVRDGEIIHVKVTTPPDTFFIIKARAGVPVGMPALADLWKCMSDDYTL